MSRVGTGHWARDRAAVRVISQDEFEARLASKAAADLKGVDFVASRLAWPEGVSLRRANLAGCRVDRSVPLPADIDLTEADFAGAVLMEVDFSKVGSLETCTFDGAELTSANLTGRQLARARFVDATLHRANLTDANLQGTNLTEAKLRHAHLDGASLDHADLTDAILEGVGALRLDSTIIRGARFMPGCREPWFELVRAFSGFNLFLHVLGLALFAAPLAFQATVLTIAAGVGDVVCSSSDASCLPIMAVLFGWTDPDFPWVTVTLTLGMIYNLARFALTLRIQALAQVVAESGRTPPYSPGQRWLAWWWRGIRDRLSLRTAKVDPAFASPPPWSAVRPLEIARWYVMTPAAWILYALMLFKAYSWLQLRIPTILALA